MPRRELSFQGFDQAIAEIERLHAAGYTKSGNWDLAQICQHLAISMERPMDGKVGRATFLLRTVGPLVKKRFFKQRKVAARVRASRAVVPQESQDEAKEVKRLIAALRRFETFPGPLPRHPIFGELTLAEWRDFQLIHTAHHLGFLIPK